MLQKLIARRQKGQEEGFTLIELMVVVLIIAILIAIAIPTFLGARSRAQNRSDQSDLRNGLTAAKTVFTDNDVYTNATATLAKVEPSLNWVNGTFNNTTKHTVSVAVNGAGDTVYLGAQSDSGICYYMKDNANSGSGVQYASDKAATCPAADDAALNTTSGTTVIAWNQNQATGWSAS